MRWFNPKYDLGDERVIKRFALWPTRLSDGHTVWLENYEVIQKYAGGPHAGFYWFVKRTRVIYY
jgi:hypothetical protein